MGGGGSRRGLRRGRAQGPARRSREKGRSGRRRRLAGAPGRGTLEKDKPPILGLIQRGGQLVIRMLANVQQMTIQPVITATVAPDSLIHTDEYDIYAPPCCMDTLNSLKRLNPYSLKRLNPSESVNPTSA